MKKISIIGFGSIGCYVFKHLQENNVSIGAGDAFNGALIAELIRGRSVSESVANAQRIATQLVENGRGVLGWGESDI